MPPDVPTPTRSTPSPLLVLALLLACVGAAARFWEPGRMVVWHDEVFSVVRVLGFAPGEAHASLYFAGRDLAPADLQTFQTADPRHTWADTWRALSGHPEHAPLYYLLARFGGTRTEPAIVGLRWVSAALSLLLLPAMAWLARELFGRGPAPWLAVALVAVAPLHLLYAQEARQYALWSVLIAAGSAALLRALRRGRNADWALYGVLLAVALYTHLLTALLIGSHGLYALWRTRGDRPALRATAARFSLAAGAAVLAFLPWIVVILTRLTQLQKYTEWMSIPARLDQLALAWAQHLARPFVDLPELPLAWVMAIPLLAVAVWAGIRHRGLGDYRLVWLLVLLPLAMVALPDLALGGRRSLESRYLMPTFLGLELLAAGALAGTWNASSARRRLAMATLALLVVSGLASQWRILSAEAWWTKSYSAGNAELARRVNAAQQPLILAGDGSVNLGELISLSYRLQPHVRLRLLAVDQPVNVPADTTTLFALLPGARLRRQLAEDYELQNFPGTWQWFTLTPHPTGEDLR